MIKADLDTDCSDIDGQFDLLNERLFRSLFIEFAEQEKVPQSDPYTEQITALHAKFDANFEILNQLIRSFTAHNNIVIGLIEKNEGAEKEPVQEVFFRKLTDNEKYSLLIDVRKKIEAHFRRSGLYLKAYEHFIQYRKISDIISAEINKVDDLYGWAQLNIKGYFLNEKIINDQIKLFGAEIISIINDQMGSIELEMRIGNYAY
jgi:hypothetical protein